MNNKIRIAIAEDHELIRKAIISLLVDEPNFRIVTDVSNGSLLLNELRTHTVDIVLMDLEMPIMGGKEALKFINEKYPSIKVIMLSMHYTDEFIIDAVSSGARGYLPKNCDIDKLIDAINAVNCQGYYFDDKMSKTLLSQVLENKIIKPQFDDEPLTKREIEIVTAICEGKTNKDIAEQLSLSIRTIEVHRKHIAKKARSTNTAGVVIYAIKHGYYKV